MGLFTKKNGLLEAILSIDDDAIVVFDQFSKIKFANGAAARMTGYNNVAMIGGDIFDIVVFKTRDGIKDKNARTEIEKSIQENKAFYSRSYEIISAKGEAVLPVEFSLKFFFIEKKKMFLLKIRDITREIERERTQEEFISTASHEMRTPVAAIQGYIGLALNPKTAVVVDGRAREILQSALDAANRLGELFKNLLDVSRLEDGKMQPLMKMTNVNSTILNLKNDFEILARNRKQNFLLEMDSEEAFCNLDFVFFHDILMDLVDNAMKYTPEGGEIKMRLKVEPNTVSVAISDNGVGISEIDLEHIFQRFYRSSNSNLKVGGAGLGLFLIKQRTEMMGGKINVSSVYGEGSTFTVTFPRILDTNVLEKPINQNFSIEQVPSVDKNERGLASHIEKESLTKRSLNFAQELAVMPFVRMAEKWRRGAIPSIDEATKRKIYTLLRNEHQNVPQEQFDAVFRKIDASLNNPGLAKIIIASMRTSQNFIKSAFITPWIARGLGITTWEFAFGYGYDFSGEWREFPENDPAHRVALSDPEFCWTRERAIIARKEIAGKERVLFLYAGCLPELRHVRYYSMPQEVWACDNEGGVNTKEIFGWSLSDHNVHYEVSGALDFINSMASRGYVFDNIVMNGATISHFDEFEKIFLESSKILKPGGKILFDVQFLHWDLMRAWFVFDIVKPGFAVSDVPAPEVALKKISDICKKIPNAKLKYSLDSSGKPYAGAMFYIEI